MYNKDSIYLKLIYLIYFFIELITLLFDPPVDELTKLILFVISLIVLITSIFSIIYTFIKVDLNLNIIKNRKCQKLFLYLFYSLNYITLIITIFRYPYDVSAISEFDIYFKYCPFTLSYNESHYEEKVCDLYNITYNSRYKYQYICSYDAYAYKSSLNNKTYDRLDSMICIPKKTNIINNEVINKFNKLYNITKQFYCSRINKPKKHEFIKDEYCNKGIDVHIFIAYFHLIYIVLYPFQFKFGYELNNIRYIGLFEVNNNNINSDNETHCGDNNLNNISFNKEPDKNIIVENHEVYDIEVNIKNFYENEVKKNQNQIINSEENSQKNDINDSEIEFNK